MYCCVRLAVVVVAAIVVVTLAGGTAEGAPSVQGEGSARGVAAFRRSLYGAGTQNRASSHCTNNVQRQYLCEMCAKETKSLQVYTLCCNGADDAQSWCQSFLVYGINGV